MEPGDLLREMDAAAVERCVVIPMMPPAREEIRQTNQAALAMAQDQPERFAVMGLFDLTKPAGANLLKSWRSSPGMLGVRVTFLRDPNLSLLREHQLEWFWDAAEEAGVPVTLLAPDMVDKLERIATDHPGLRLVVDHLNLHPSVAYDELVPAIQPLLRLARRDNVAVKASALPCWARDSYPFPSLHRPIAEVVEAFGARRVFWGSDLSRLQCTYSECVRLFTEQIPALSEDDLTWIMGRGVTEWLGWPAGVTTHNGEVRPGG
jgi:predicted TIM-barrel fold metal-dependent hydrolase